ncbi:MAG: response regulator [Planctomycetota bacterium]
MRRILFVDDEARILDGLRRMLRSVRKEWDMHFAESGAQALAMLEADGSFDVVVSDMRMPGMDGAELLTQVQERSPATVRILLSGHAELELAMRSSTCAHQFLAKPCDSDHLKQVVTRSYTLHERLRDVVGKLRSLPALPAAFTELTAAMQDEEVTIDAVADIVVKDTAIAAKVLQLVNSSFFGVARRVDSLRDAVSFLGLANLKTLVLTYGLVQELDPAKVAPGYDFEAEQAHALAVANLARRMLAEDRKLSEQAFLAGMLHDVGRLVLACNLPDLFERVERLQQTARVPAHDLERRALGITHADIGAYLLGIWGMPDTIVEVASLHNEPGAVGAGRSFDPLLAVHVADALLHEIADPDGPVLLETALLTELNLDGRLAEWRELAASTLANAA